MTKQTSELLNNNTEGLYAAGVVTLNIMSNDPQTANVLLENSFDTVTFKNANGVEVTFEIQDSEIDKLDMIHADDDKGLTII